MQKYLPNPIRIPLFFEDVPDIDQCVLIISTEPEFVIFVEIEEDFDGLLIYYHYTNCIRFNFALLKHNRLEINHENDMLVEEIIKSYYGDNAILRPTLSHLPVWIDDDLLDVIAAQEPIIRDDILLIPNKFVMNDYEECELEWLRFERNVVIDDGEFLRIVDHSDAETLRRFLLF
jgi:hypothetical protein